jgi:hypothetical protein
VCEQPPRLGGTGFPIILPVGEALLTLAGKGLWLK